LRIAPLHLDVREHKRASGVHADLRLYDHQAKLFDRWNERDAFVVAAPTGSGKTQAALLPCIAHRDSAIFLYPTNALMRDQYRSFDRFFSRLNLPFFDPSKKGIVTSSAEAYRHASAVVCTVDSLSLEELRHEWMQGSKGRTLETLLSYAEHPLLILTNPDTLFLLVAQRYQPSVSALTRIEDYTLVIDEFHLYSGVPLARLMFLIHFLMRSTHRFVKRVVFLSATPDPEALGILSDLFAPIHIEYKPATQGEGRIVQHPLDLQVIQQQESVSDQMAEIIHSMRPSLLAARQRLDAQHKPEAIPLVAITNSVFGSINLEDSLRRSNRGWTSAELGVYRGLSNKAIRDTAVKIVVLGTSAIEVGVDFETGQLVFEASSAQSFLQRIGRLGRHGPGWATLIAPDHVVRQVARLGDAEISRTELAALAEKWYARSATYAWFVRSKQGMMVASAMVAKLKSIAERAGSALLLEEITRVTDEYLRRLHTETLRQRIISSWQKKYAEIQSFRGSASIDVYDHFEARRRANNDYGRYEADLATVLRYGHRISEMADSDGRPYAEIQGYEKGRELKVTTSLDNMHSIDLAANAAPLILAGGVPSPFGNYFCKEGHICCLLPLSFESQLRLDWRLQFYEAAQGILLFDDDALLGLALYEQRKDS
jgi:CRISPR-associated endonuclease/helicase Cas3